MDCVCAIQMVNGKDKILKCLWIRYSGKWQAHWFECVKNCNAVTFWPLFPLFLYLF
jgi:hypothetical protein